jgi:Zn-dependent peptidase ImmA (M78 family)/DNA-binding XRE family transcriptional regulator
MIGKRLKQLRLARGLSLDALVAEMGGLVTKQAVSKYELGKAKPTTVVLNKLARTLGVKAAHLWSEPEISVQFIAYRKGSGLPKKEQTRVEAYVKETLAERIKLQDLTQQTYVFHLPVQKILIKKIKDAENASEGIRDEWNLGHDPIASVTGILEDHFVHVLEIEAGEKFDGISAIAYDDRHKLKAAAVVSRKGIAGERQRLNLAHELGHLVLKVADDIDEEKAAFRFAAAFLAPADAIYREVGSKRSHIETGELLLLKQRFGISIQALLYRLHDLGIITDSCYKKWFIDLSRLNWRKTEPYGLPQEHPQWLRKTALRAFAEGILNKQYAEKLIKEEIRSEEPLSLVERRSFMKMTLEERRKILASQAEKMRDHYNKESDTEALQGGDIVKY